MSSFQTQANDSIQTGDEQFIAGNFEEALASYNTALKLFQDNQAQLQEADTLFRISNVYQKLGSVFSLRATKIYRAIATGEKQTGPIDPGTGSGTTESKKKPSWIPPITTQSGVTNGDPGGVTNGNP